MITTYRPLVLLVAASAWSCSDPALLNGPTAPTAAVPAETARGSESPTVEPMRRVEEVGSGGDICDICVSYPGGRVRLAAAGGELQGEYSSGTQFPDDIYRFAPETGLNGTLALVGSGRLAGVNGVMDLSVNGSARLLIQLSFAGGIQKIAGSAVPTFRLDNDGQCPSGRRLTTTFELTLEYLGKTSITDTHCTAN